jgi:hypothetical protein
VTSFFIRPTESNIEKDKVQKHHTSKTGIAKPLVISLQNHFRLLIRVVLQFLIAPISKQEVPQAILRFPSSHILSSMSLVM